MSVLVRFIKKILLFSIFFFVIYGLYAAITLFLPFDSHGGSKPVTIERGESPQEIAAQLRKEGIIRDAWLFEQFLRLGGYRERLRAGEFVLSSSMDARAIARSLTLPSPNTERSITLIEGFTLQQIEDYLVKEGVVTHDDFQKALNEDWKSRYTFLQSIPKGVDLEGYLFPDTYRIFQGATAHEIVQRMLDTFDARYTKEMRAATLAEGRTIHEIVTMASILEEEAANDEDRNTIAGIFYNRIKKGMRLQSDATVNYVTKKSMRQPLYADTEIDSPYNTYRNAGLPPGPIDSPSLSSLMAAIYPKKTDYLYFLHTKTGETIYAKTYEEHLKNKAKYLQ